MVLARFAPRRSYYAERKIGHVGSGPRRQNSTSDDRADLLAIVRETRPWAGSKLRDQLRAHSAGHGWEAATLVQLEDVAGSFRELLPRRSHGVGDQIDDQEIDDETACDAILVMLANVMKGRDPRNTDLLSEAVSGPPLDAIPESTRRRWREEGLSWRNEDWPADGGLRRFLKRYTRRVGLAYLVGTKGYTVPNARAWLKRHPDVNPTNARPAHDAGKAHP